MSGTSARPLRLILLGPPASGKGTQGRRLAERLGLDFLSTGALLREEVEARSEVGKLARPILDRGGYLPDDIMCRLTESWLARRTGGWVLDGFPRSVPQAGFLEKLLSTKGLELDAAISLEAPFEVLLSRIEGRVECPDCRWSGQTRETTAAMKCPQCGGRVEPRPDDSVENFTSRHREFIRLTRPLIDHYGGRGLLCPCDATAHRDEVTAQLVHCLESRIH